MGFFEEFGQAFFYNPFKALAALYWYVTRRKVRGRNLLRQISSQAPYVYDVWVQTVECLDDVVREAPAEVARWTWRPTFSLILHVDGHLDSEGLRSVVRSVERQCYPDWELLLVEDVPAPVPLPEAKGRIRHLQISASSDAAALEAGINAASGQFIMPLSSDACLSPGALFWIAQALQGEPEANIVYGDHDEADRRGRRTKPWFKSGWNREMFLAQDYVSPAFVMRTEIARSLTMPPIERKGAASFALLLEASAQSDARIAHVPHIICHLTEVMGPDNQAARLEAVSGHLEPSGGTASAGPFGLIKVEWPLPAVDPLVSIIIPTRDKVEFLHTCVESLLRITSYPNFEVIIVDNGSVDRDALQYLSELKRDPRVQVLHHDAAFNYSELNNLASVQARGEFLCLLNNDTEIISADWLTEMMRYAVQDHIGAVGAKLLYPDGSVQHAGVVIGIGNAAGHAHRLLRNEAAGYFGRAHMAHYVSAVTAACLVIAKRKFLAVGGLDAKNLKVAFNDVDLCLRIQEVGWTNVYVPQAVLVHHESKSRGSDHSQKNIKRYLEELAFLQKRWATTTCADPLHHPNLDRASETYVIRL